MRHVQQRYAPPGAGIPDSILVERARGDCGAIRPATNASKSYVRAFSEVSLDCAPALFQRPHLLRNRAHTQDVGSHREDLLLSLATPTAHGAHGTGAHYLGIMYLCMEVAGPGATRASHFCIQKEGGPV